MLNNFDLIQRRITVRDILEDHGIEITGKRIACPIHGGNNKTSFSFNDSTFNCFSCGAKGGLIDLVQYLRSCNRRAALEYLEGRTDVKLRRDEIVSSGPPRHRKPLRRSAEPDRLKTDLAIVEALQDGYTRLIQMWRRAATDGTEPLVRYYAKTQFYEHELEHLDAEAIGLTHQVHCVEGGLGR